MDMVISQLGVTQPQAEGGIGALLSSAKGTMGDTKYGDLMSMLPGLNGLADKAPGAVSASGGSLGGLASAAGGLLGGSSGNSLAGVGQIASMFESLGLSPEMVGQFSKLLLDYAQSEGGAKAFELLKGALPI